MGYGNESRQVSHATAYTANDDLAATGDSAVVFDITGPITVRRIGVVIAVATVGTAAVVKFDRRITTGSDTGRGDGDVGALTVPALAAGKIVYKDVKIDLDPGDQIVPQVTTAQGTSGEGRYFYEYENRHETPANCADMVASA
jgi:hypothetical protein